MTMNEKLARAKNEARQKEAVLDMLEWLLKELDERKGWYCDRDEDGNRIPPAAEGSDWNLNTYNALCTIEAHLAKLI